MLQNVQSVTTFPLPPSKNPDFIGTTENGEKNGKSRKQRKRAAEGANGKWGILESIYDLTIYDLQFIYDGTYLRFHRFVAD